MEQFLRQRRTHLADLGSFTTIHLVVGNESCDLDSAIAALVLAYVLQKTLYESDIQSVVIPILNIPRKELRLRTELSFWFQDAVKLDNSFLICRDELNYQQLAKGGHNILVSLVDHNENKEFEALGKLVQIIDHHKPSRDFKTLNVNDVEIKEGIGSCCSLIAKRYLDSCKNGAGESQPDVQIALMLYGPILLDTTCFAEDAQKFSEDDKKVINELETIIGSASLTRQEVYQQLITAKNSVAMLTFDELLEKDMKVAKGGDKRSVAVSSLPGLLAQTFIVREEDVETQLENFRINGHYAALVILGIDNTSSSVQRDIALYSPHAKLLNKMCERIENAPTPSLSLQLISSSENLKCYTQGNVKASRKVILPIINEAINDAPIDLSLELERPPSVLSNKKAIVTNQISTADVDSDFVEYYRAESVDVPDSTQHHLPTSQEIQASPLRKGKADSSETVNNVTQLSTSPKQGVNGQQQQKQPTTIQSQTLQQQPPKLIKSVSKTSSVQPPSLCYYESYFDDSYVGDFTGDVDPDFVDENIESDLHNWCDDSSISNSILEFGFDSFGPESLPFNLNGNADQNANDGTSQINDAESELLSLSVTEPQLRDKVDSCFDQRRIRTTYDLSASEVAPTVQEMNDNVKSIENEYKRDSCEMNGNSEVIQEQTIAEETESTCRKNSNIEIIVNNASETCDVPVENVEQKESRPNSAVSSNDDRSVSLSRSSTLNRSLRRKIKPKFNFEQILNTSDDAMNWKKSCPIGTRGEIQTIDMKVIEPYKKVISHAGYYHHYNTVNLSKNNVPSGTGPAIITFSACYMPDRSRKDYSYVHLFMYVLTTLHELVADDYMLIYFHNPSTGGVTSNNMPTLGWLKRCYYMIDRRLRKNLRGLYLVHPTFWLKTLVIMTRKFISSKFSRKLRFVSTLQELNELVPMENSLIPAPVKQVEFDRMIRQKKKSAKK